MSQASSKADIPLTLHLTAELAQRLKTVAEMQKRSPAELAVDLLDRNLPRSPAGAKKAKIPYT